MAILSNVFPQKKKFVASHFLDGIQFFSYIIQVQKKYTIDINADLGEGAGQDALLMPFLSSCNIATGGHAGDAMTITNTIILAQKHQVKIGAHPSYPDFEHFGRVELDIKPLDLKESLLQQISSFCEIAHQNNVEVNHIKAHGALYNKMAKDEATVNLFLEVLQRLGITPILYIPYNSTAYHLAKERYEVKAEVFIDRKYHSDLSLVSRNNPEGLIKTPQVAWDQLYDMVVNESITTLENTTEVIKGATFCIHGDHPNAQNILEFIHERLNEFGIYTK